MSPQTCNALRIALLSGGVSDEREVSLSSGLQVYQALQTAGHEVQQFDPAEIALHQIPWGKFDGCFIALHGGAGEDGRVQCELERLNIAYTGSGPTASQLAMDKAASKQRFKEFGLLTPDFVLLQLPKKIEFSGTQIPEDSEVFNSIVGLGFPLVVKPNSQGSSLGVGIVHEPGRMMENLAQAAQFDSTLMIEKFIKGRELTVSLINRYLLPVLEIIPPDGRYDYEAKYHRADTEYRFELGVSEDSIAMIQQSAVDAAAALGTSGLVRVDIILDVENQPWVLEVNTIPGMTPTSLAPKAAKQAGLDMPQLCDQLVQEFHKTEMIR